MTVLLCGIACAPLPQNQNNTAPIYIDPGVHSQVELFETLYHIPVNMTIKFVPDLGPYAGVCHSYGKNDSRNWIEIDADYWSQITDAGKDQLILHELGHCVLGLEHRTERGQVGAYFDVPLSIMYPVHFGDNPYYSDNLEYYYQELIK